jgi:hypothetical protein
MREAMVRVGVIAKAQPGQNFKFRGRDVVVNHVNPILAEVGITVHCIRTEIVHREHLQTKNGAAQYGTLLLCTYRWTAPDGSFVDVQTAGEGFDMSDKATGKAHSYALRECIVDTLLIKTDDPEPDAVRPGVDDVDELDRAKKTLLRDVARMRGQGHELRAGGWIIRVLRQEFDADEIDSIDTLAMVRQACFSSEFDLATGERKVPAKRPSNEPTIERGHMED